MDTRLMELLVCPICKGPLGHDHQTHELVCQSDRLAFPIRDGIAVMLEGEARSLDAPAAPPAAPAGAEATPGPDAGPSPAP